MKRIAALLLLLASAQTRLIYEHALSGFSAAMEPRAVAGVRCQASVRLVEHNRLIAIDD